jgi:hypothetical protein
MQEEQISITLLKDKGMKQQTSDMKQAASKTVFTNYQIMRMNGFQS